MLHSQQGIPRNNKLGTACIYKKSRPFYIVSKLCKLDKASWALSITFTNCSLRSDWFDDEDWDDPPAAKSAFAGCDPAQARADPYAAHTVFAHWILMFVI